MTLNAVHHNGHQSGEPTMYSPTRRAAKALAGLVVAAGVALAADPPGGTASPGEGAKEKQIFSEKLPNVPGKTLTVVQVDYRPGGSRRLTAIPPPASSSRMSSRAPSAPRSRASPSASTALARPGPSRPTPTTSSAPMRARPSRRG